MCGTSKEHQPHWHTNGEEMDAAPKFWHCPEDYNTLHSIEGVLKFRDSKQSNIAFLKISIGDFCSKFTGASATILYVLPDRARVRGTVNPAKGTCFKLKRR